MQQPLVTVGLPIYNRPEGLRNTLECFINQTYKNIEIIIADNCSPNPEVEKIAKEYVVKDKRISYFRHDSNKGWGFNTIFVIDKAKGKYFIRATDDDWWDNSFIEKMVDLFQSNSNIILASSEFNYTDIDRNVLWNYGIKNHYEFLKKFSTSNKKQNLKDYINQFEGFGKASMYLGMYNLSVLKDKYIQDLLYNEDLMGDLLINLYCLIYGEIAIHADCLINFTIGNPKFYKEDEINNNSINLYFIKINYIKILSLFKKWNGYFSKIRKLILKSKLNFIVKLYLLLILFKRRVLFYYDLITVNCDSWPINLFYRIRRKYTLG
jgi:glycosyltransferase involved in cell wall biosynthesis